MPGSPTTKLLVTCVPKVPGRLNRTHARVTPRGTDELKLQRDPSLSAHVSRLILPGFQEFSLTHKEVTCRFKIRMTVREDSVVSSTP